MKNPTTAAVLSAILSGLGQFYNGQTAKGVLLLILQGISIPLFMVGIGIFTFLAVWIWGIVDAYKTAVRINTAFTGSASNAPVGGLAPKSK